MEGPLQYRLSYHSADLLLEEGLELAVSDHHTLTRQYAPRCISPGPPLIDRLVGWDRFFLGIAWTN